MAGCARKRSTVRRCSCPVCLLVGAAWAASLLVDDFEAAVTLGMCTLVVALFAYTWVGGGSEDRRTICSGRWVPRRSVALVVVFKVLI